MLHEISTQDNPPANGKARKHKRILAGLFAFFLVCFCFGGCTIFKTEQPLPKGAAKNEILTMTAVDQSKTLITAYYEYGVPYQELEAMIEAAFPEVDLVMVHLGVNDAAYALRQGLQNNTEIDLVFSKNLPSVSDIAGELFVDLSSQEFAGNYFSSALNNCADREGRLYCLPGPSDVYGVVYDRTLFQENGWEVPHSYSEFVALVDEINRAGLTVSESTDGASQTVEVKAIQPALMYADAFQIVFNTFAYPAVYSGAANQQWLMDYQDGRGSMIGHMEPAAERLKALAQDGVISAEDFEVRPRWRSEMLYTTHSTAMIFENQNAYSNNMDYVEDAEKRHEVGIFPFWTSDEPDSDYLYAITSYYMAINRAVAEQSEEKGRLLLEILDFLSQPDAQKRLVSGGMRISNVQGVPIAINDFSREVQKTIEEQHIIHNFFLAGTDGVGVVEWALRDNAALLLEGKMNTEEWLRAADEARDDFLQGTPTQKTYGIAERTFTKLETVQLMGDMYREATGAPIALVFSGYGSDGVTGRIYSGAITEETLNDISPIVPTSQDECGIACGMLSGKQIMDILSGLGYAQSHEYVLASGLQVRFAPWHAPGERLLGCSLMDGTALDPAKMYLVAYFSGSLKNAQGDALIVSDEKILPECWEEIFLDWLEQHDGILHVPEITTELIWTTGLDEE